MPLPLPVEGVPATPIPDVFEGLKVTPPKFFLRASAWSLALPTPAKCGELTPVELGEVGCPRILYITATSGFSFETSITEFSRGDRDSAFILSRQCWNIGFFAVVTLVTRGSLRSKSESWKTRCWEELGITLCSTQRRKMGLSEAELRCPRYPPCELNPWEELYIDDGNCTVELALLNNASLLIRCLNFSRSSGLNLWISVTAVESDDWNDSCPGRILSPPWNCWKLSSSRNSWLSQLSDGNCKSSVLW